MHLYVDESKAKGFLVAAVFVSKHRANEARKALNALRLNGQRSLHFVNERDSRRRKILSELARLETRAHVIRVVGAKETECRRRCLEELVNLAEELGVRKLIFELDESYLDFDTKVLSRAIGLTALNSKLTFIHLPREQEPLLWMADAIAWSYNKGGEFEIKIRDLLESERKVTI
jgi:hypothetical protein